MSKRRRKLGPKWIDCRIAALAIRSSITHFTGRRLPLHTFYMAVNRSGGCNCHLVVPPPGGVGSEFVVANLVCNNTNSLSADKWLWCYCTSAMHCIKHAASTDLNYSTCSRWSKKQFDKDARGFLDEFIAGKHCYPATMEEDMLYHGLISTGAMGSMLLWK